MSSESARRFGRGQKAMALVPLALLSAGWTAAIAGADPGTARTASAEGRPATLPDGTTIPSRPLQQPASVSPSRSLAPAVNGDAGGPENVVSQASISGIPAAALAAYQRAATVIDAADPGCHLRWQLIGAIGRVESDHGRFGGNTLDADGIARPGIFGPVLDGRHGTARILDTDNGLYDGDTRYDRAVGPMQFIPSTWAVVGVDADGDGQRNPQDINDAALASAVYLCAGDDDLATTAGQRSAVHRYNHSQPYVDLVLSIMRAYVAGDYTSVPNAATAGGVLVPQPAPAHHHPGRGHHQGSGQGPHDGGQQPQPGSGTTPPEPSQPASPHPSPSQPSSPPAGGVPVTLPPLPSTSSDPVDQVLTYAQAVAQCTLEGYVDNPLRNDDPFDKCVYDYTH